MKHPSPQPTATRHATSAAQREQALCMDALATGEYDNLSDQEWIELCERIAREEAEDKVEPGPAKA